MLNITRIRELSSIHSFTSYFSSQSELVVAKKVCMTAQVMVVVITVVVVAGLIRPGTREGILVLPAGVAFDIDARLLEVVQAPLSRVRQDAVRTVVVDDPEGQEEILALVGRAVGRAVFLDHGNVGVLP